MGYKVKLNVFEGPFDLLVYLIEHAQMNIYDIPIAEITSQYLSYIEKMKQMEVAVASEFMVLAAALIEIKSKMLLPGMDTSDNEIPEEDPRTELVEKLLAYKRFKLLAEMLEHRETAAKEVLEKPQEDLSAYTNEPDEYLALDLKQFVGAFRLFLQKKKKLEEIHKHHIRSEKQRVTAETRISGIGDFFRTHPDRVADFRELIEQKEDKYDIVLTFSSVLEMVKQRKLSAEQMYTYGDIKVKATEYLMEEGKHDQQENDESSI